MVISRFYDSLRYDTTFTPPHVSDPELQLRAAVDPGPPAHPLPVPVPHTGRVVRRPRCPRGRGVRATRDGEGRRPERAASRYNGIYMCAPYRD